MDNRQHLTLGASAGWAKDTPTWPEVVEDVLPNGLELLVCPLPHLRTVALSVFVRVGSRFEGPPDSGLSHLLEHMLFRGCAGYEDTYAFNAALEAAATGLGASTYREFTAFDTVCAPAALGETVGLVGRLLSAPLFRDIEVERRIILEEIQDEVDENGRDIDPENVAKAALFPGCTLGAKIGGDRRRIAVFDEAACRRWYAQHYAARNMVVAIAGKVDPLEARAIVERALGELPSGERATAPAARPRPDLPALEYVRERGSQTTVHASWVLPAEDHPDWPALHLAQRLLDDGTVARLRRHIVDERGLAYHVGADIEVYEGLSLFTMEATVSHRRAVAVVDAIFEVVAGLVSDPASDEEWTRLGRRLALEVRTTLDSPGNVASWLGLEQLNPPRYTLAERYERLLSVARAEVARAAARYLVDAPSQLTVVGDLSPMDRAAMRRRVHRHGLPAQEAETGPAR